MEEITRLGSQFFAAEGAADGGMTGETAAPGVETAAPGQTTQALEALGVPRQETERYGARFKPQEAKTAAEEPADKTQPTPGKSMAELVREDPALNRQLQMIVSERVKAYARARDTLKELQPALELLAQQYGLEAHEGQTLDYAALTKAITEDDRYWEEKAAELGVTPKLARKIVGYEQMHAAEEQRQHDALQERQFRRHVEHLIRQGEELKGLFPNFDLQRELGDPKFRLFTSPQIGMSVKDAFYAIHHDEIRRAEGALIARRARTAMANNIAAGRDRPSEGGMSRAALPGEPETERWTRERIESVKRQAEAAGARGEKFYIR